jgi:hypothetical protein
MEAALQYTASVLSHGSIFEPLHCDFCTLIDLAFCEFARPTLELEPKKGNVNEESKAFQSTD